MLKTVDMTTHCLYKRRSAVLAKIKTSKKALIVVDYCISEAGISSVDLCCIALWVHRQ